jgi:hypothetical protein
LGALALLDDKDEEPAATRAGLEVVAPTTSLFYITIATFVVQALPQAGGATPSSCKGEDPVGAGGRC